MAAPDINNEESAAPSGRWPKGQSGNPAGRPKGAKNKTTLLAEQLEADGEPLLERRLARALEGDSVALRFCLARLLPPAKHRPVSFELPALTGAPAQDAATNEAEILEAYARDAEEARTSLVEEIKADALLRRIVDAAVASRTMTAP